MPSDVVSGEEVSQSRNRAAYEENQCIVQEESCGRMNEWMWKDKQGQLADIWVWRQRVKEILQNGRKPKDQEKVL